MTPTRTLLTLLLSTAVLVPAAAATSSATATTNAIVDAAKTCLYNSGIRRIEIDAVRIDGSSAVMTYDIPDAGTITLYLAFDGFAWHCLGGTGGIPSARTYEKISAAYAQFHLVRSASALHDLATGARGQTLMKVASPKAETLTKPTPRATPRL